MSSELVLIAALGVFGTLAAATIPSIVTWKVETRRFGREDDRLDETYREARRQVRAELTLAYAAVKVVADNAQPAWLAEASSRDAWDRYRPLLAQRLPQEAWHVTTGAYLRLFLLVENREHWLAGDADPAPVLDLAKKSLIDVIAAMDALDEKHFPE
jgi:hypothetical protein